MAELPPPRLLPPPRVVVEGVRAARDHEVLGLWLQIIWLPIVLMGGMMILSAEYAFFGLPIVLVGLAPCAAGRMRHRGGCPSRSLLLTGLIGTIAISTAWTWLLIASNRGEPVEQAVIDVYDGVALLVLAGWTIGALVTSVLAMKRPWFQAARPCSG
ncbi:MAG: hypothetical protein ACR2HQ_14250 [Ilumatobacteraceae bacterium]